MTVSQSQLDVERSAAEGMGTASAERSQQTEVDPMPDATRDRLRHLIELVEERTREKPAQTLGIAAGVGVVVGLLLGGRFGRQLLKYAVARGAVNLAVRHALEA